MVVWPIAGGGLEPGSSAGSRSLNSPQRRSSGRFLRERSRRAVADHLRLHARVRHLRRQQSTGDIHGDVLGSIAELPEAHVRFEEQELFPPLESGISENEVTDLATAGRRDV